MFAPFTQILNTLLQSVIKSVTLCNYENYIHFFVEKIFTKYIYFEIYM